MKQITGMKGNGDNYQTVARQTTTQALGNRLKGTRVRSIVLGPAGV